MSRKLAGDGKEDASDRHGTHTYYHSPREPLAALAQPSRGLTRARLDWCLKTSFPLLAAATIMPINQPSNQIKYIHHFSLTRKDLFNA